MANNSSDSGERSCITHQSNIFLGVYLLGVMMHIHIVRVLISKLKLQKQMHQFLLSLSLADLFQMIGMMVTIIIVHSMKSNFETNICRHARRALYFFLYSMIGCSSGSIIAISVERYIACIHCFRLHSILTKKRTIVSISLIWCAGLFFGAVVEILLADGKLNEGAFESGEFVVIYVNTIIILATSAVLIFVQARLFVLIRAKMRVHPGGESGVTSQARSTFFVRQVKISVAVGAVVVAYLACMLPLSLLPFLKPNMSSSEFAKLGKKVTVLNLFNPALDPFIYGIGIMEIRNTILSDYRSLARYVVIKIS